METKNQDRISELVEKQKDTYTSMADEIWGYPVFSRKQTARSVVRSQEKQMDMAVATIFSERHLWRLSMH